MIEMASGKEDYGYVIVERVQRNGQPSVLVGFNIFFVTTFVKLNIKSSDLWKSKKSLRPVR